LSGITIDYILYEFISQQKRNKESKDKVRVDPGYEVVSHYAQAALAVVEPVCGKELYRVKNAKNDKTDEHNQLAVTGGAGLSGRQSKEAYQHTPYLVNHYLRRVAALK